ncbi:hypothetical protein COLO4_28404 [Corchorus olitorius]|uniref:Uncharacterized protein n=1 Tax=Corchorus olitorius TaxID=93759 RepID=A0A1R3HKY9_9ROSI|nr:hypothetical protein COLO4_28404 [Corchorus olitorius]
MPTLLDALSLNPASVSQDQAHNYTDLAFTKPRFPFLISDCSCPMRLDFEYVILHPSLYQTPLTILRSEPSTTENTKPVNPKPSNPGAANPNSNKPSYSPLLALSMNLHFKRGEKKLESQRDRCLHWWNELLTWDDKAQGNGMLAKSHLQLLLINIEMVMIFYWLLYEKFG